MFTGVPAGEHNVTVTCTSKTDSSLTATAIVSGLEFLIVTPVLESAGTTITVLLDTNIEATFVDCKPWTIRMCMI